MRYRLAATLALATAAFLPTGARAQAQAFTYGSDPSVPPGVYAIENARIVTEAGAPIAKGTIVVRDGLIVGVGAKVSVPPDAKVIDANGMTVYPGFIDAFTTAGMPAAADYPATRGDVYHLSTVRSDNAAASLFKPDAASLEARRKAGFGALHVAPSVGIFAGTSALVSTGTAKETAGLLVRGPLMMRLNFDAPDPTRGYPESLMGEIAAARQAFYHTQDALRRDAAYAKDPRGAARPATPRQIAALEAVLNGKMPLIIHADSGQAILRALRFDKEFGIRPIIEGAGEAYKVAPQLKAAGATVLLTLNLPEPPVVKPGDEDRTTLQDLRRRAQAPLAASALAKEGVPFAFSTEGLTFDKFAHNVRRLIAAGLSEDAAIAALTVDSARLLGVDRQLGTVENGKIADLIIVDGGTPFDGKGKIKYAFVDGESVDVGDLAKPAAPGAPGAPAPKLADIPLPPGVTPEMALQFLQADPNAAKPFLPAGMTAEQAIAGLQAAISGKSAPGTASAPVTTPKAPTTEVIVAPAPVSAGMVPPVPTPVAASFVLRGATAVWTVGPQGTVANADVFVRDGKIAAIGANLKVPTGTLEIDARGRQITPGMIDCHSHTAIEGGVNEGSNIVTAECRIGDVLNAEDVNIYRQLAGGTTAANVLHGSANAIGGQNAVVKWRWGATADELIFADAPSGIKFALGENPKQSNFQSSTPRYPNSRMGVEKVIRQALTRARDYRTAWAEYKKGHGVEPRRDLQLDALVEVLEGKRYVHSHSYRQDEILMLIRLADEFGFHVRTFQHGLEGYKVADEIRIHGAGVSTFSDWWAYKIEAYDAIPYNGALLEERGVVTSFNSDSDELARRLNYEAAKAVHWGGMKPDEAIKLLTINPAIQLGVDKRVGSLEVGKDADIAVWSGDPLSTQTVCEKTFVDGRLLFDRQADIAARATLDAEKKRLAEAEKASGEKPSPLAGAPAKPVTFPNLAAPMTPAAPPFAGVAATAPPTTPATAPTAVAPATATTPVPPAATPETATPPITTPVSGTPAAPRTLQPLPQKTVVAAAPTGSFTALVGGTVHPISGPEIANGVVIMQGDRIVGVGPALTTAIPDGATRVDVTGKHVYPGLIDADTQLGLDEIESIRATNDDFEMGDFNPDLHVAVALNPDSELLPVARQNGILTAAVAPNGGTLDGIGSLIALSGWTAEDLTLDRAIGEYMDFPTLGIPRFVEEADHDEADRIERDTLTAGVPQRRRGGAAPGAAVGTPPASDDSALEKAEKPLNDLLDEARRYRTALLAEGARDVPQHPRDGRYDALLPILDGRMPLIVRAERAREIRAAVAWAKKQNLRMILLGGDEADQCADLLATANIPVILDPVLRLPRRRDAAYDDSYTMASRLYRDGVRFCFATGGASDVRRLPWQAAMASAFGLPADVALRAVTLTPAEILGEANRLGSLDVGKDATLIVTDGSPLEITTTVQQAWIRGTKVDLTTKQSRLYERYRARPRR